MAYIANNAGQITGSLGNQQIGRHAINLGTIKPSGYSMLNVAGTARHEGDFNGAKNIALNNISGKYEEKYDDPTYYG